MELNSGKKFIAKDENKYMNPASNIKLLTFLASINTFDSIPSVKYYIENDTILNFKSTGFPLLLHPFYPDKSLINFFENKDQLVYHNSKNKIPKFGPGWSWDDYNYYFSSEISAFPIYGNVVSFYKDSLSSKIKVFPKFFNNKIKVIDKMEEPLIERGEDKNVYLVNEKKFEINDTIQRPFITSDSLFINLLSKALKKKIKMKDEKNSIIDWKTLYTKYTEDIYKALLHDSDNLIAESLLLMVSNYFKNDLDNKKTINDFILDNFPGLKNKPIWYDGSGLSRYNMLTTSSIIQVLKKIHDKIGIKKIMIYFPEIKADSKRLSFFDQQNQFKVFAKTGTLSNNHSLSGYIFKNEKLILFSFMVNHHNRSLMDIQKAMGKIITKVLDRI